MYWGRSIILWASLGLDLFLLFYDDPFLSAIKSVSWCFNSLLRITASIYLVLSYAIKLFIASPTVIYFPQRAFK